MNQFVTQDHVDIEKKVVLRVLYSSTGHRSWHIGGRISGHFKQVVHLAGGSQYFLKLTVNLAQILSCFTLPLVLRIHIYFNTLTAGHMKSALL